MYADSNSLCGEWKLKRRTWRHQHNQLHYFSMEPIYAVIFAHKGKSSPTHHVHHWYRLDSGKYRDMNFNSYRPPLVCVCICVQLSSRLSISSIVSHNPSSSHNSFLLVKSWLMKIIVCSLKFIWISWST